MTESRWSRGKTDSKEPENKASETPALKGGSTVTRKQLTEESDGLVRK